jgi:hypothetical protein
VGWYGRWEPCGCIGHNRKACKVLVGKPENEDYLENRCIHDRVILKWIVSERDDRVWIGWKTGS